MQCRGNINWRGNCTVEILRYFVQRLRRRYGSLLMTIDLRSMLLGNQSTGYSLSSSLSQSVLDNCQAMRMRNKSYKCGLVSLFKLLERTM